LNHVHLQYGRPQAELDLDGSSQPPVANFISGDGGFEGIFGDGGGGISGAGDSVDFFSPEARPTDQIEQEVQEVELFLDAPSSPS
jgi:hypothetical protein